MNIYVTELGVTCYLCLNSFVLQVEVLQSILFVFYHSFHVLSYSDLKIFTFGASVMLFGSLFQCSTTRLLKNCLLISRLDRFGWMFK